MADILIAAGQHESALALARDDRAHWSRLEVDWALEPTAKLVDAEIAAGDRERAAAGDPVRARSLLAEVLVLGRWYESVKLVAKVAPDALGPVLYDSRVRIRLSV